MSPRRVVVRAPAKVNLTLSVLGKRPDGFHEIDTVMLALELADRLEVRRSERPGVHLELRGPGTQGVPADASNLVVRAAQALLDEFDPAGGLECFLEKHVPSGGGLGGGSSDAAAALFAACSILDLDPDAARVQAVLAGLGSDCRFFLAARRSGLARCTGRGELVEPWAVPALAWPIVVAAPAFGCVTARVYAAHEGRSARGDRLTPDGLAALSPWELEGFLGNDLLSAALRSHPALGDFRELLAAVAPGRFRLSGSGSSWFALARDAGEAQDLASCLVAVAEERRYALRGPWVTRAAGHGVIREL